jgi:Heterokaryon incompatibility protein (HET)
VKTEPTEDPTHSKPDAIDSTALSQPNLAGSSPIAGKDSRLKFLLNEKFDLEPLPIIPSASSSSCSTSVVQEQKDDLLCRKCAMINLDEIFAREYFSPENCLVKKLGCITSVWLSSKCPLCRLFATVRAENNLEREMRLLPPVYRHHLFAIPSTQACAHMLDFRPWPRSTFLAVLSEGISKRVTVNNPVLGASFKSLVYSGEGSFITYTRSKDSMRNNNGEYHARILLPDQIDYGILLSWLEFCKSHHTSNCRRPFTDPVPNLRFIDCQSRRIVTGEHGLAYAALTYVWGDVTDDLRSDTFPNLPSNIPNVVQDAIEVVSRLNMRYLWIDRYCIPREESERHHQINNMDLIYGNAEVTIVAAAGKDPTFGLPGVGKRVRLRQPVAWANGYCLVSTMRPPNTLINASKWWERAWVLQEALFSRRRLIFTTEQVFFECQSMSCSEVLDEPLEQLHHHKSEMDSRYRTGLFPNQGTGKGPFDVAKLIETYSRKKLTYESDGLNAIAGLFRMFGRQSPAVNGYWGVPFVSDNRDWLAKLSKGAFLHGLLWIIEGDCKRRKGQFPTWSWVGFVGPVNYSTAGFWKWSFISEDSPWAYSGVPDPDYVALRVERKDQTLLSWESFIESGLLQLPPSQWSRFIEIEALTATFSIVYVDDPGSVYTEQGKIRKRRSKYWVKVLELQFGGFACSELKLNVQQTLRGDIDLSTHSRLIKESFDCLILGQIPFNQPKIDDAGVDKFIDQFPFAILIDKVGDFYERLGIFHIWPQQVITEQGDILFDTSKKFDFRLNPATKKIRLG